MRRPGDRLAPGWFAARGQVRRLSVAFMLLAAGPAVRGGAAAGQIRGEEVATLGFEGNTTFPDDSLARAIVTRETACRSRVLTPFCWLGMRFALRQAPLRERELPRDQARIQVWYYARGFRDVRVDAPTVVRERPGEVDVVFRVDEGRPVLVGSMSFTGAEDILANGLLDGLPLRRGDRLSSLSRDAAADTITRRLRNLGFAHADVFYRVFRPDTDPYNAQVTFEIVPGTRARYGAIEIEGNQSLTAGTILRTLQFTSGDVYQDTDIETARARLFGLEIIRSAQVLPDLGSEPDSVVPVRVLVQEGDAYRVRAGGGWSTAECLNLEARWSSRNFVGGGRVLQVRARLGNLLAPQAGDILCRQSGSGEFARLKWLAAIDFAQPWIFSTGNSLSMSAFAERQAEPDVFVRRAIGFQTALTRVLDARTIMTVFHRPELSELDAEDVLFCTGFLVCTPDDIRLLERANRLAPLGLSIARDRSDDLLNPHLGYRLNFDVEHAAGWTGSSFRYDRIVTEATAYTELAGSVVLASRLRAGWVGSGAFDALVRRGDDVAIIHPQRRFFAGGANSVRGFSQSRLGPRVLFADDPVPLMTSITAGGAGCAPAALIDLSCDVGAGVDSLDLAVLPTGGTRVLEGNLELRFPILSWLEGVAFSDFGQAWGASQSVNWGGIEVTPGFGVRFPSPVGPIRVDVAFRTRRDQELSVIARQVRAYDPAVDLTTARLMVDGVTIPYVRTNELGLLTPSVMFMDRSSRFQIHISIGQAF